MHPLLAGFGISLSHGGNTVRLRPSLQAATRLERLHNGFAALFHRIEAFDTDTIRNVILISATDHHEAEAFLVRASKLPLASFQQAAKAPLEALCASLLPDAANNPKRDIKSAPAKPLPWVEAFADLFAIATGLMHWPPQAAWQATPTEIVTAFNAHIAMLEALRGTGEHQLEPDAPYTTERLQEIKDRGNDPAFDRAGLRALKNSIATGA